jgi:hypothetical protein
MVPRFGVILEQANARGLPSAGWLLAAADPAQSTKQFEKTSLDWQFLQLQQQIGESLERWLQRTSLPRLNWPVSESWGQGLLVAIACLLAIWLGWQLFGLLHRAGWLSSQVGSHRSKPPNNQEQESEQTAAQWVQRSQMAARQRNYGEACRALYLAMVQRLHESGTIPAASDRTDGEYLHLVRTLPNAAAYEVLIQTHERLYFGNATISASGFNRCQQAYQQIETANP